MFAKINKSINFVFWGTLTVLARAAEPVLCEFSAQDLVNTAQARPFKKGEAHQRVRRCAGRPAGRLAGRPAGRVAGRLAGRPAKRPGGACVVSDAEKKII